MTPETWPVVTSPTTGHPEWCGCADHILHDIDQLLTLIRRHLVSPAPVTDKALGER